MKRKTVMEEIRTAGAGGKILREDICTQLHLHLRPCPESITNPSFVPPKTLIILADVPSVAHVAFRARV